jgi:hypothetical protein
VYLCDYFALPDFFVAPCTNRDEDYLLHAEPGDVFFGISRGGT